MKQALLCAALLLAACNRERSYEGPRPAATARADDTTWVAQPGDLSAEQVRVIQRSLGDRGFAVELTGTYDDQTRVAMGDFQRSRGLPATGNLNADTAEALGIDPADVRPVRGTTPPAAGSAPPAPAPDQPPAADEPQGEQQPPPRLEPGY